MSAQKMSVKEFWKQLRSDMTQYAEDNGWNLDKPSERGYTFQLWTASIISAYEQALETAADDSLLYTTDLGVDLVFEDNVGKHLVLCQCKYQKQGDTINEVEVNDFFRRHKLLLNSSWVRKHGSEQAVLALGDYAERMDSGWTASFYFVSTGRASDRVREVEHTVSEEYVETGVPVRCRLMDFSGLKDYYLRSLSLEESVPEHVEFQLPGGQFFLKEDPHRTLIAVVKGNSLRNLAKRYKESLFAWNIRGYLGNRGINQAISDTAREEPDLFFYFNNGISAICTRFEIEGNVVRAENFQVINGAQTISTLARQDPNSDVELLFRLTKTQSVKTEKGLNQQIIRYNNSQNQIKVSDFRSNDQIQQFLEKKLRLTRAKGALPKLRYARKRQVGRRGVGQAIRLEDLAKIRYSFLHEPTMVHSSPKALWTLRIDDGVYEDAFGVDGELESAWADDTLQEALTAIALYLRIDAICQEIGKRKSVLRFLRRLRYHAVSLLAEELRRTLSPEEIAGLHRNERRFSEVFDDRWEVAMDVLIDSHQSAMKQDMSMFAFVRSAIVWSEMAERFELKMEARRI